MKKLLFILALFSMLSTISYANIQTEYLKLTCSADTTWNSKGEKKSVWFAWAKDKLFVHMDKKKGLVVKLGYSKNKEDLFDHKIVYEKIKEEEDITAYKFITNTTSGNIINLITIREWDSRFYSFWMDQYRLDYKQIEAVKKLMIRNTFSEFKKAMEKESTGLFWNSLFGTHAGYCNHEIRKLGNGKLVTQMPAIPNSVKNIAATNSYHLSQDGHL